jgi:hypothetical protein
MREPHPTLGIGQATPPPSARRRGPQLTRSCGPFLRPTAARGSAAPQAPEAIPKRHRPQRAKPKGFAPDGRYGSRLPAPPTLFCPSAPAPWVLSPAALSCAPLVWPPLCVAARGRAFRAPLAVVAGGGRARRSVLRAFGPGGVAPRRVPFSPVRPSGARSLGVLTGLPLGSRPYRCWRPLLAPSIPRRAPSPRSPVFPVCAARTMLAPAPHLLYSAPRTFSPVTGLPGLRGADDAGV